MANTIESLQDAIAQFCETITGWDTFFSKGNGPQPAPPHIMISDQNSIKPVAHDVEYEEVIEVGGDIQLQSTTRGMCTMEFIFTAVGVNPTTKLNRLRNGFWNQVFDDAMARAEVEIGLSDVGTITDVSDVFIEDRIEDRAQIKVSFYASIPDTFDVDHIESTEVTVKEESKEYSNTFKVPPEEDE